MPITTIPTKTEPSLGQVKVDAGSYDDPTTQVPAAQIEEWKTRIIEVFSEVGLSDGTTSSSINAQIKATGFTPLATGSAWTIHPSDRTGGTGREIDIVAGGVTDANAGGPVLVQGGASVNGAGGGASLVGGTGITGGQATVDAGVGGASVKVGTNNASSVTVGRTAAPLTLQGSTTSVTGGAGGVSVSATGAAALSSSGGQASVSGATVQVQATGGGVAISATGASSLATTSGNVVVGSGAGALVDLQVATVSKLSVGSAVITAGVTIQGTSSLANPAFAGVADVDTGLHIAAGEADIVVGGAAIVSVTASTVTLEASLVVDGGDISGANSTSSSSFSGSVLRLNETSAPTPAANEGDLYTVDDGGETHLRYKDDASNVWTITSKTSTTAAAVGRSNAGGTSRVLARADHTHDGGVIYPQRKTGNFTLDPTISVYLVDTGGGNISATLPAQTEHSWVIKKITTDTNKITLVPDGTDKIEGTNASFDLPNSGDAARNAWLVMGSTQASATGWWVA